MDIPPLTALRCFEAAARLGGVTAAARELHVTHSAVSQQIKSLEQTMGLPLFVRESKGLRLTEEGRLYALEIRSALRDIAHATRLAQARPNESELVLATLPSFATHWLLPRLDSFRVRYPQYSLRLHGSLELQGLRDGLTDVGIRMGQGHWPDLAQQKLFDDESIIVGRPDFARTVPLSADDIMAAPRIVGTDAPWADWCRAAEVAAARSPVLATNDSNISLTAVLAGQGISLERRSLVSSLLAAGTLQQLSPVTVPYPYAYWLVWPQREVPSIKRLHFAEWLVAEVATYLESTR